MTNSLKVILIAVIFGALAGSITTIYIVNKEDTNKLIKDFYLTENAVHVSPHHIRKAMAKGDSSFILVDLRSEEEYEKEHVAGALNIPAYKDPDTSAYGDVERIVNAFKALGQEKEIIVYCYSMPCMTGRKVGKMLSENDIYVKHLGIGWNEWRYFWNLWNHEHEWDQVRVEDYIVTGSEPGVPNISGEDTSPCSVDSEFAC